ncbi:MAG: 50S ribosomal protein L29 [Candidatus Moranbacteria bacterium]|nr:50S ribosomal protein L29 [Candidatus Moranbacteria bacterium]NTW46162.1 50S ribosomal protein L29 [Candidatus Moranbacteria bacterium]
MNMKELRDKSQGERETLLLGLRKQVRELRFSIATREMRNHREHRAAKRDIARLLTLSREEELNG